MQKSATIKLAVSGIGLGAELLQAVIHKRMAIWEPGGTAPPRAVYGVAGFLASGSVDDAQNCIFGTSLCDAECDVVTVKRRYDITERVVMPSGGLEFCGIEKEFIGATPPLAHVKLGNLFAG
jgi:hypothetical protein